MRPLKADAVSRSRQPAAMSNLADAINAEHQACKAALQATLDHAICAGDYLLQAKGELTHGQWLPWLKDNCHFSRRTAQNYMRLAEHKHRLTNAQTSAHLSIDAALKRLAAPRPERPQYYGRLGERVTPPDSSCFYNVWEWAAHRLPYIADHEAEFSLLGLRNSHAVVDVCLQRAAGRLLRAINKGWGTDAANEIIKDLAGFTAVLGAGLRNMEKRRDAEGELRGEVSIDGDSTQPARWRKLIGGVHDSAYIYAAAIDQYYFLEWRRGEIPGPGTWCADALSARHFGQLRTERKRLEVAVGSIEG